MVSKCKDCCYNADKIRSNVCWPCIESHTDCNYAKGEIRELKQQLKMLYDAANLYLDTGSQNELAFLNEALEQTAKVLGE